MTVDRTVMKTESVMRHRGTMIRNRRPRRRAFYSRTVYRRSSRWTRGGTSRGTGCGASNRSSLNRAGGSGTMSAAAVSSASAGSGDDCGSYEQGREYSDDLVVHGFSFLQLLLTLGKEAVFLKSDSIIFYREPATCPWGADPMYT